MGTPEGKIQIIDTVSQNNLNTVKKHKIFRKFRNIGSRVLGGYPQRLNFKSWRALSKDPILRSCEQMSGMPQGVTLRVKYR